MTDVTPDTNAARTGVDAAAKAGRKTFTAVADAGQQTASAAAQAGQQTFEAASDAGRQSFGAAQKGWTDAATAGNQAFKDQAEKSLSALNEMNAQGKRNLEAMVASVTAATRAAETIGAQAVAYTKSSMEKQVEAARAVTGARSVQEAVELQTSFARQAMETYVSEMNKVTEIVSSAMKDTLKPLNERATAMMESAQSVR